MARRLDFVGRAWPTHVFERPEEALARGGGVAGRWQQQQHAASAEQALANGWRCAGRRAWPGREVGRRGALGASQYGICRLRGRGFVCWRRPRAGRPGLSGRRAACVGRRGGPTIFYRSVRSKRGHKTCQNISKKIRRCAHNRTQNVLTLCNTSFAPVLISTHSQQQLKSRAPLKRFTQRCLTPFT